MTSQELQTRHDEMNRQVSAVAGCPVEVTFRGEKSFTFSTDGNKPAELNKIGKMFPATTATEFRFDSECDLSCLFVEMT